MDASAQPATTRSASLEDFKSINDNVVSRDETDVLQKKKARGVIDVFLGRNRDESKTQNEPVVWTPSGFFPSVGRRLEGVFTKRFLLCVLLGQLLSFCLTATSVVTTQLGLRNWAMPTTQSLFFYFTLNLLYTPYTIKQYGIKAWGRMLVVDGWKYILLAAVDVEANFLVIKAYGYTDLLSCQLLNSWATPACMIFAFFLVKARYHWSQFLGVAICITGLGLTVVSDWKTDKNYPANNRVLGDILMLIGATGYGLSNALEEFFVRQRPLYEVVGQIGFWGCIINAIQGAGLEHDLFLTVSWSGQNIGLLIAYTCAMLCLYTCAPVLFRMSSSVFYNISIITSNFYGLCFGLGLYGYRPFWLYFVAYPLVLVGLLIYFLVEKPEAIEMDVVARGNQADREEQSGKKKVVGDV